MDKNTVIGLGLIGLIMAGFFYFNQPTEEELLAQRAQQEMLAEESDSVDKSTENTSSKPLNSESESLDSESVNKPTSEEVFVLENDELYIEFSNLGGGVKSVKLKNHQTYQDYISNQESGEITPLLLFEENATTNSINFKSEGKEINSSELLFSVTKQSDNFLSFKADLGNGKSIEQIYSITPSDYHINYEIKTNGLGGDVSADNIYLDWGLNFLQSEKLLTEQRRTSTIFYKEKEGSYKYLSETKSDEKIAKTDMDWVAFKQSYFSSILIPNNSFLSQGSVLGVEEYKESNSKHESHVKNYSAAINLGISNPENGSAVMKWYFGPNDYEILKSYEVGTEDLLNYGWGLFRWINVYVNQPLFNWLASYGFNFGIVILILTVIIKLVLTPIQWKMFSSSVKMRILKPQIDAINEKYPDKDQAMDKQMEMMNLYKESGASPLAGCVPMLIQMPILFAVFRFFPSTFALRQKAFLWADDLSSYDSIYDFGFNIPLYGDHISLFTLLMAGTTLGYTIMNSGNQMQQPSQPGMPNMKVIMYFFPIMMIFFFNNYASGLSYYYFISTLMSILTMIAIKNFFIDEEKLKAKMEAKASAAQSNEKPKGKSRFQQRLEEMQRLQQEKMKEQKKNKK